MSELTSLCSDEAAIREIGDDGPELVRTRDEADVARAFERRAGCARYQTQVLARALWRYRTVEVVVAREHQGGNVDEGAIMVERDLV